jgi:hypothetical protein
MFKKDGSCPACRKHPDHGAPADPDKTLAVIGIDQPLPSCCMLCGAGTERRERMVYWYDMMESKTALEWIMSRIPGNERRKALKLTLPVCIACSDQSRKIRPLSVRFGLDYRMVVHRDFHATFEALNGPPQSEPT